MPLSSQLASRLQRAERLKKQYLELQYPSVTPKPTGKTLIVWEGATSVGSNAIQLGIAAGYEAIITASPQNFDNVKKLGASQAFDYHSKTIIDELVTALQDKTTAGAFDSIGVNGAVEACADVLLKLEGNRFIAIAWPLPEKIPDSVHTKSIFASDIKDNEVSKVIYEDFLPRAPAEGKYIAVPDPMLLERASNICRKLLVFGTKACLP